MLTLSRLAPALGLSLSMLLVACSSLVASGSGPADEPADAADLPDADMYDGFVIENTWVDADPYDAGTAYPTYGVGPNTASSNGDASFSSSFPSSPSDPGDPCGAIDASVDGPLLSDLVPLDASPDATACQSALAPGDLIFDEAMISSVAGSDDSGQWLEVRSTRSCSVDLIGLHASAPHGTTFRTMDVTTDVWLPPGGFFLIADTLDPTENNNLPGLVFAWAGSPSDALHKTSDTVTLSMGTVTLDTLNYPDTTRTDGTSISFPSNCATSLRGDFDDWQPSTAMWTPGFYGTPGAANLDVRCTVPVAPTCSTSQARPRR
jgi:hypothetical protein